MKTATKLLFSLFSLSLGTCGATVATRAARDAQWRYLDRLDAADREIARIVSETDADRRDAAIVASLVGRY